MHTSKTPLKSNITVLSSTLYVATAISRDDTCMLTAFPPETFVALSIVGFVLGKEFYFAPQLLQNFALGMMIAPH